MDSISTLGLSLPIGGVDHTAQMNAFRSYVSMLADPLCKDENKLKAAQALNEDLETIVSSPHYTLFLEHAMKIFLKLLADGESLFIAEYNIQQLRKLILEMIHRLPSNEQLKVYLRPILTVAFTLLETDNEENVMVCLHIITELHKTFRPQFTPEIQKFLQFVKNVYRELPNHIDTIFEPKTHIKVNDLSDVNIEAILNETFTITSIATEKKLPDGSSISYNVIPRAVLSLKVLTELPIIFVLMLQLYKDQLYQDVVDFIPIIMDTIILQPAQVHRDHENFNREVFVDLCGAQIKILSFLAYIVKSFQEKVSQHSPKLVTGMLNLLELCPNEVASLRKELLIATKHILALELRNKFVPHIDQLFDENLLFGKGWTVHETLRPLAYSTLADLIHHVRQQLDITSMSRAVHLFSKNIHDESLPTSIQTMSCKLLLNLVDSIRNQSNKAQPESVQAHDLLIRMLHVFVYKFKSIALVQLPYLKNKQNSLSNSSSDDKNNASGIPMEIDKVDSSKCVLSFSSFHTYSVTDCRALVKTLISGVKTITWGCSPFKPTQEHGIVSKPFNPKETIIFIKFVKWAMQALEIYSLPAPGQQALVHRAQITQAVKSKEEKEVLEHFAGVFIMMHQQTFKEIFSTTIDYVVERIHLNFALQAVANTFLARQETSPIFATILVEHLLKHMEEMGTQLEKASMYLRLFKLVFGSVSILASENEQMLKPYLHQIVNKSMELSMTARDSYNYFLLLRALFRSIGGGNHDILYQEFLPLLPTLLQGLNSLQSGSHKQHMKDLFVELCLTVPVRLSSLLPYLPMLMDPLVSALNGSQTLISQGLRTLELCVDNLQPDFLYEHIQPVRAELMHALWKTLRNPNDQIAQVAFIVIGKFGGGNRKMMAEPQLLEYCKEEELNTCVTIHFPEYKTPIILPIEKVIEVAFSALRASQTEPFYRQQAWEVIRCFLVGSMQIDEDRNMVAKLISHPDFIEGEIPSANNQYYKCSDENARRIHQTALTAMFVAAAVKELRKDVLQTMVAMVRHYAMIAIVQQAGPFCLNNRWSKMQGMDPFVLIDALAVIIGHEERELSKPGHLSLVLIINAATDILGSKQRACQLPLMEYLADKMCSLCYNRAWYAKLGGCLAINTLSEHMSLKWVLEHQYVFLRALLYVMIDLTDEVSTGAIEKAKMYLEKLLYICAKPLKDLDDTDDMREVQNKSIFNATNELVRQVTSSNTIVREQAIHSLRALAELMQKGITDIILSHREVLIDMIPPKKNFILRHQPANIQIGLMEGNTFCTSLEPRIFTLDLDIVEHNGFFTDLLQLVEKDDASLFKFACYKNVTNLIPLRKSALKALTACYYIPRVQEKIFLSIYKALNNSSYPELQETAFECLQKFQKGCTISRDTIHSLVRPLLTQLCQVQSVTLPVIQRLSYLTQLFPNTFTEKLCEQLVHHLKILMENAIHNRAKSGISIARQDNNDLKLCANIVNIFHQIPSASTKFIEILCKLILQLERALVIEASSLFRDPLMKFLLHYSDETISHLLSDQCSSDQQYGRYLEYILKNDKNAVFLQSLRNSGNRLLNMIITSNSKANVAAGVASFDKSQQQYIAVKMIWILTQGDPLWLCNHLEIASMLQSVWISDDFQATYQCGESVDYLHWKTPKLIVSILLLYFKQDKSNTLLLFQLHHAFIGRFVPDFQFLKEFLEQTVAQSYSVAWKRNAFFQFVELFEDLSVNQDLKAKILKHVIIPCFSTCLNKGERDELIGYAPAPDKDFSDNIVSVFINKIIDPDEPFKYNDPVRILLLQLSCLLVEKASAHIHDADNKRQGVKLRRLMTFAWPCLLSKNCVDPATKYHGHLLLSHIISKFAIHKRIVLQVFHSLLKAHAMEARSVVRQALEILTPSMPIRMEDGNTMLTHWTRKILVEEGHTVGQLVHILQLIVRHAYVYYPVRHHLTQNITQSMHRLGFTPTANLDQRRLAVDLAEVCIKWEEQRVSEEDDDIKGPFDDFIASKKKLIDLNDAKRPKNVPGTSGKGNFDSCKPMDKTHADGVVYFLLRLACQVNESSPTLGSSPPGEALSKRCVALLKRALSPDIWRNSDPKLIWMDKFFLALESQQPNLTNISVGLELFAYLVVTLKKEQILHAVKNITKGLLVCIGHPNQKIIKLTHSMLSKLMSVFPIESSTPGVASKYEELEELYSKISKLIFEGLNSYNKNPAASPTSIYGTIMILKAVCQSNQLYIDRLITPFMSVLQRLARDHLNPPSNDNSALLSELLVMSLELVKNRVGMMGVEMRKSFIGQILVGLIEKTPDSKVIKSITKIVEEWVKNKNLAALNQGPSVREKSILLVKLMQYVEKRFPDDTELQSLFLVLINFVYTDESFKMSELTAKLEPAFLAGLRFTQPQLRAKFFQIFDESMKPRLFDRLLYIVCSQNWENLGPHYWIKQCIQLLLVTAKQNIPIRNCWAHNILPSISDIMSWADPTDRANFCIFATMKTDTEDTAVDSSSDREMDYDMEFKSEGQTMEPSPGNSKDKLKRLLHAQNAFIKDCKTLFSSNFINALCQLSHMETSLAEWVWLQLFPKLWKIMSERQQQTLSNEIVPFLCSGAHVIQKDCHPSALNTFIEALTHCQPPIPMRSSVMKYLGKSHNLWYRMTLLLEERAEEQGAYAPPTSRPDFDGAENEPINSPQQDVIDSLSEIYSVLKEDDLWAGLWQTVAHYPETRLAVTYEQHGFLEQSQAAYELAMSKSRSDIAVRPAPVKLMSEMKMWEDHWVKCAKELNQWELVLEYGRSKACTNPLLILESSWHVYNWTLMKDALAHVEQSYPKEMAWKVNLYRGYLAICRSEEQHLNIVEKLVELASALCIKEWKRLPSIVSHVHLTYLQGAQQVMELQEASQVHQAVAQDRSTTLTDLKAIVKTWRYRLLVIADPLSHWSDIFTWRQHHYQLIVKYCSESTTHQNQSQSMFGVHASAQTINYFGKIARKHNLTSVCLDSLSKIHTIQSVPVVDCFQKIRQQVKCYHQTATANGMSKNELQQGLEVIESTNLKFFTKEMTAEFYALKGTFLSQLGRTEEANKALSASVQLHDTLVKGWAMWGDYLEGLFTRDPTHLSVGVSAITCFLHATRHQHERKTRKYLAKVFWLLSFDDEIGTLSEAVDRYAVGVPAIQWLPWIPQLLTCLVRPEGKVMINVLNQVGKMFPQAVYLPIRTLYLTLRIEQRGKYRRDLLQNPQQSASNQNQSTNQSAANQLNAGATDQTPIRATEPMWRCSRILQIQRDCHPTVLVSLEGIAEQMGWFRENWYEEVLRQLRQALAKCYSIAFENAGAVADAAITPHMQSFVEKLVATFGIGFENTSTSGASSSGIRTETGSRRASQSSQSNSSTHGVNPVFHKLKGQFTTDFDFSQTSSLKLHNLIHKLKKWIKILELKMKLLPKWFLLEEKCKFMSNFSAQTAEVNIPGEFLLPKYIKAVKGLNLNEKTAEVELPGEYLSHKQSHYYIRIARFLPRVDIVQKHGTAPRRLHILGHNGKVYPYLVVSDSSLSDGAREERLLQLLRMLNVFFSKQKETSRRLMHMNVMRVVAVSPQMRLVEDNESSLSLLDVCKMKCVRHGFEADAPLNKYYEKLASIQSRGGQASPQVLRDVMRDVQNNMIPKNVLKSWAVSTFPNPTNYWTFRKMLTMQLSITALLEYCFHLNRLFPEMMYIHQDSGFVNVSYFKFNVDDAKGELDGNWPVPFRLTPNLSEFITAIGVNGPYTACMISAARCFATPSFKIVSLLRAILRDEIIAWHKRQENSSSNSSNATTFKIEGEALITRVNKAVSAITSRIQTLSTVDGSENKVTQLVQNMNSIENLCRMDPAWHPWL